MKTSFFRPQILQQNVQMDGSINFMTNGDINVYPCPWEDEKQVTGGERVRYRAGIEVDADGRTRVKRYNDGLQGPKHDVLYETPHGAVKVTRPLYRSDNGRRRLKDEYVYVTFKFPKKYGLALTKALYEEEADQIMSYLKTRKEETIWK
ncbi:hypothetical protein SAMN05216354_0596 [Xylanibacter ruminicola]|uniref:Uncharacterized protein n=1 Tax=Xylanibacter ruminicola TaxID=839 RepID=A0A1H5SAL7_XYLRU|nr:hypothetical protein [Xylanibacter ruminicola]SEF47683.1 hypothetical protein SAMN05216354_0596 [Xylanibacter ruminicola]